MWGRKTGEEAEGDRELNCNTAWYCDDTCFFTSEKHAIRDAQVTSRAFFTHEEETDFTPRTTRHTHKTKSRVEQKTAEEIGSCRSTLILLGDQLFRWLRQWRRPQGAAVDWHRTTQSAAVTHTSCDLMVRDSTDAASGNLINVLLLLHSSVVPGVGPCYQAYLSHKCRWWIHRSPWSSPARGSTRLHSWPPGLQRSIHSSGPVTHHCSTTTSLAAHLTLSQSAPSQP